jgi:hypothetical protein
VLLVGREGIGILERWFELVGDEFLVLGIGYCRCTTAPFSRGGFATKRSLIKSPGKSWIKDRFVVPPRETDNNYDYSPHPTILALSILSSSPTST